MANILLNKDLLPKLERLEVAFRRAQRGRPDGERSSSHHGGRIEFADYRQYAPGDDFRTIDWNVLSRTDEIVVKQFEREEQYRISLILDASASMDFPRGGVTKLEYAAACLASLAYIGLASHHQIELAACAQGRCDWFTVGSEKEKIFNLLTRLEQVSASGGTDISGALQAAYDRAREQSLIIVFTDLLGDARAQETLGALASRGCDISIVHVVSREEVDPSERGRMILRDAETGQKITARITDAAAAKYKEKFREHCEGWSDFAAKHDIRFLPAVTDAPFEDFVLRYLRHGGLVR